jgi:dTDP-4-dehydrorhamnose reductase
MRVLVTGISGLLGQYLLENRNENVEVHGISRVVWSRLISEQFKIHRADLTDSDAVTRVLDRVKPDVIIHAAAEGRVDIVEARPDEYRPLNVRASADLAILAESRGIQYVFISSNAVFGGNGSCYSDNGQLDPVNQYGILKAEAEKAVLHSNPQALVIRPLLMYGWPMPEQRLNPVVGWINQLRKG